ncbi:PadR family transcriptional regulator [Specibacter cremeus]|uniref:PadR family transcriptional regulator n=1 Tax=Specibacter cremeus TaxID=1629051 RepID=UPI000F79EF9F|nr:PadR family transcriptional regulator [Specibacter cremeus]
MSRKMSNPLALAVLASLWERPMYPYQITSTLRERRKEDSIRLNYGSLYAVIKQLEKRGLIAHNRVEREGNRPERIVYEITDAGRVESVSWLSELLSTPAKEYPQFEAGLSLLPMLPPAEALRLLTARVAALDEELALMVAERKAQGLETFPELFMIESDYYRAMLTAERAYVADLAARIAAGTVGGFAMWERMHRLAGEGHSIEELFNNVGTYFGKEAAQLFEAHPAPETKTG